MSATSMRQVRDACLSAASALPLISQSCVRFGRRHPTVVTTAVVAGLTAAICSCFFSEKR